MSIRSYDQLIESLTLMKANLPGVLTEVGGTAADVTWVNETLENLVFVRDFCATSEANKVANTGVKASYFNGPKGSIVSDLLVQPAAVIPNPPLTGGVLYEFRDMADRFELGPGYTDEIGIAIGIASPPPPNIPGNEVLPEIVVDAAQTNRIVTIITKNRGEAKVWQVQILRKGATVWETVATCEGRSADVQITLSTPGEPEQIQVRIQLRKDNQNYGQLSQAATVTVNP